MTKYIGAHVQTSGGIDNAIPNAKSIGAKAFALFVKNQLQWTAKPLKNDIINSFKEKIEKENFSPDYILPHAGYLINLGHPVKENRIKSLNSFIDEIHRCRQLGLRNINIHPGSHLRKISEEESLNLIIENINYIHKTIPEIKIILETTSGQGSNLGYNFEHFGYIIRKINTPKRFGICMDICHTFSAGYNLKDPKDYELTMKKFEKHIGFNFLSAVHLNDSKHKCGSRKDRHEQIGKGYLGIDFFERFMNDERFDNMPIILETPDRTKWKSEIKLLYSMIK